MKRFQVAASVMILGLGLQAAEGKHIAHAVLQSRTGATVASAQADPSGHVRFMNVPPGEYRLVLTNADGRSVTVADLDGDGINDIIIEGAKKGGSFTATGTFSDGTTASAAPPATTGTGAGAGKVSVQDLSLTKRQTQGATFGEKAPGGALPGGAVVSGGVVSPRDHASGLPTGKRQHKPYVCLVDWDLGTNKGGYTSERMAQAEGEQLPANTFGRCAIKVVVDEQPGTIEVLSWSWGASQAGKHTKTGHVTLMK